MVQYYVSVIIIKLTVLSNFYCVASTIERFTIEILWLMELIFSDTELQNM